MRLPTGLVPGLLSCVLTAALLTTALAAPAAAHGDSPSRGGLRVAGGPPGEVLLVQTMLEAATVAELNRVRRRAGCRDLTAVSTLRVAARRHSTLMARRGQLSHRLTGEATLALRTSLAGYTRPSLLGEVLAVGPRTPYGVVRVWLGSAPHRALVLDCRFRHVGIGVAGSSDGRRWWTVDLGRR